jgi:hypothetical protein
MRNGLGTLRRAGAVCRFDDGARIWHGDAAEKAGFLSSGSDLLNVQASLTLLIH